MEAVGKNVTQFRSGDEVFGDISDYGSGAFTEYVCAPTAALAQVYSLSEVPAAIRHLEQRQVRGKVVIRV